MTTNKKNKDMTMSDAGIVMLKGLEGVGGKPVLKAYWDYKGWSIGYGHFGAREGQRITAEEAERLLREDVRKVEREVNGMGVVLQQCQFDALTSLVYKIGSGQFRGRTVRRLVLESAAPREALEEAWFRWNKVTVNGHLQVSAALGARRSKEYARYCGRS